VRKSCKELKRISRGALAGQWVNVILAFIVVQAIISIASTPFSGAFEAYYLQQMSVAYEELGIPLSDFITIPALPSIAMLVISFAATLIISLAGTVLSAGQLKLHLNLLRNEKAKIEDVFTQFKYRPDRFILASLLLSLIGVACMVPLIIVEVLLVVFATTGAMLATIIATILTMVISVLCMILTFYITFRLSQIMFLLADHPEMGVIESFKESWRLMKGNCGRYLYIQLSFIPLAFLAMLSCGIGLLWVTPYQLTVQGAFYMDITGEFQRIEEESRRLDEEMGPVLSE